MCLTAHPCEFEHDPTALIIPDCHHTAGYTDALLHFNSATLIHIGYDSYSSDKSVDFFTVFV